MKWPWLGYALLLFVFPDWNRNQINELFFLKLLSPKDSVELLHKAKGRSARNQSPSLTVGDWLLPNLKGKLHKG